MEDLSRRIDDENFDPDKYFKKYVQVNNVNSILKTSNNLAKSKLFKTPLFF